MEIDGYIETLEVAMQIALGDMETPEYVDAELSSVLASQLSVWVLNSLAEDQEEQTEEEDDGENALRSLIENAINCAYVFARITENDGTNPTNQPLLSNNLIVNALLANGKVTLTLNVD